MEKVQIWSVFWSIFLSQLKVIIDSYNSPKELLAGSTKSMHNRGIVRTLSNIYSGILFAKVVNSFSQFISFSGAILTKPTNVHKS